MPNTREKLIELITDKENDLMRKQAWFTDTYRIRQVADHLIANGVTLDNQVASSKWISAKDRLPEDGAIVFCYTKHDDWNVMQWSEFLHRWADMYVDYRQEYVTHWMPLPQPPKGE